jgi:hypothetical protein
LVEGEDEYVETAEGCRYMRWPFGIGSTSYEREELEEGEEDETAVRRGDGALAATRRQEGKGILLRGMVSRR